MNFSPKIGFKFDNFKPQAIFQLIQKTAKELGFVITHEEMFRTFNMGWGFGVIINEKEVDNAISILEKDKLHSEVIGKVTDKQLTEIQHQNRKMILT